MLSVVARLDVEPVFTAHPTESSRRALLEKEQDILRALIADLSGPHTPHEREADWARLRMALTTSWQTADISHVRPTVADELEHVISIWPIRSIASCQHSTKRWKMRCVLSTASRRNCRASLRFASWVGGDMDGNPNVDAETIAATLRTQRERILSAIAANATSLRAR